MDIFNCSKANTALLDVLLKEKMQYSYKDLYQTCQLDTIRGHIQGTLRLAKLSKLNIHQVTTVAVKNYETTLHLDTGFAFFSYVASTIIQLCLLCISICGK